MPRTALRVWWGADHVADLEARRPWDLRLRYTRAATARWATNAPLLSCSLPVQRRAQDATPFCKGLLPEGQHRQAVAALAGVASNDVVGLLARYGRDVAGALVIAPDDTPPSDAGWGVEEYTEDSLLAEIRGLEDGALGVRPDSELSIAGLQDKMLLVRLDDGTWARPIGGRPSTHILKVDDDRYPGLVAAEAACLHLARRLDVTDVDVELDHGDGLTWITVERFDRAHDGGVVRRVHQEDACQALGIDPDAQRGRAKYESHGGPSWRAIADLLRVHAEDPEHELTALLRAAWFTVLIGNADGHGKNISLLHDREGYVSLAPLYDTVPTVLWPRLRSTMAMSIDGSDRFEEVTASRLLAEVSSWGLPADVAARTIADATARAQPEAAEIERADLRVMVEQRRTQMDPSLA